MKRLGIFVVVNLIAVVILVNFFFGSGGVSELVTQKVNLSHLAVEKAEKELSLLSQESELLSESLAKNYDEYLLKHGYKPENTIIFRFVTPSSSPRDPHATHLLSRLYLSFGTLVVMLFIGEILLYFVSEGESRV